MYFFYILLILLFASSYMLNVVSLLYTESFVLFLAFFTVFIYISQNTSYKLVYSKDDFKWNELILFYISLKNWNRSLIRDRSVKIFNFLIKFELKIDNKFKDIYKRNINWNFKN